MLAGCYLLLVHSVSINNIFTLIFIYSLVLSVITIINSNLDREIISELFKVNLMLAMCVLVYRALGFGSKKFFIVFLAAHLIVLITAILFPNFLTMIFPRYVILEGGRGFSYFSSEPSYSATYLFFIGLAYTLGLLKNIFNARWIFWALCLFLLSTLSMISFLFFIILAMIYFSGVSYTKRIYIFAFSLIFGTIFIANVDRVKNELFPLVNSVISGEESLQELAIKYPSASTRVVLNSVAIIDGYERRFSIADIGYNSKLPDILHNYGLDEILIHHEVISHLHNEDVALKPQAMFPYLAYSYALFSIIFIIYPLYVIALLIRRRQVMVSAASIALFIVFFLYQSQYSNPIQYLSFILLHKFILLRKRSIVENHTIQSK